MNIIFIRDVFIWDMVLLKSMSLLVNAQILFDLLTKSKKSYKILLENTIYAKTRYTKL